MYWISSCDCVFNFGPFKTYQLAQICNNNKNYKKWLMIFSLDVVSGVTVISCLAHTAEHAHSSIEKSGGSSPLTLVIVPPIYKWLRLGPVI